VSDWAFVGTPGKALSWAKQADLGEPGADSGRGNAGDGDTQSLVFQLGVMSARDWA